MLFLEFIRINDLNEYLLDIPVAFFFVWVCGDSMSVAGIYSGDRLIVEKALTAENNEVIIATLDSVFTIKRYIKYKSKTFL